MRLPNLFIVGAAKCGTTSLHRYLSQHPDIFMAGGMEPIYFGGDIRHQWKIRDRQRYFNLFADAGNQPWVGEKSVWYMASRSAAAEIRAFCPEAKIIIMLRNPVDMVYSLHAHFLWNGNEDIRDFDNAVAAVEERKQGRRIPPAAHFPEGLNYLDIAKYTEQVARYLAAFPASQVHIIIYDDFRQDPLRECQKTFRFLGVDDSFRPAMERHNPSKEVKSLFLTRMLKTEPWYYRAIPLPLRERIEWRLRRFNARVAERKPMGPELRGYLQQNYAADIQGLSQLLDRDLTHWCRPAQPV